MLGERTSPHPRLADLYSNLAYCYRNAGRFDEAVATAYRAIDVTRRLRGESSELAGGYQDLGNVLRYADRFVESCAAFEEALQTISGVTDINAATVEGGIHNDMAAALLYRGKYREAVEHSYRAMELLTRRPELLTLAMQTYGQTLSRLGELHRARCVLENSVQMHKAFRVRDLRMLGRLLHALADVLEKLHDPATSVVRAEGVAYDEASGLR
jgi:tetratricopeptide (TPR) repeat protein